MIKREDFMTLVHSQQFYHWQYYLNNRSHTGEQDTKENTSQNGEDDNNNTPVENES